MNGSVTRWSRLARRGACAASLAISMSMSMSSLAEERRQVIDPNHLTIGFLVEHVGYAKVLGMFRQARGEFWFDDEQGVIRDVRIVVDTDSVFTNQDDRDRHLRSADFLDVEAHPQMIFESAGTTRLENRRGTVSGQLTLIGATRPLHLEVTWNKTAPSPMEQGPEGPPRITGISARGVLARSDYGMSYGLADALVGDRVELIIELESRPEE